MLLLLLCDHMSRDIAARLALLGIVAALAVAYWRHPAAAPSAQHLGATMPDFQLQDLAGRTWRRSDLMGKTVFINVWASW